MKTFQIADTDKPGDGTKNHPFPGVQFDVAISSIKERMAANPKEPVRINVGPGEFVTRGIAPGLNWDIRLSDRSTLKLADLGPMGGFKHPNNCVIASAWDELRGGPPWLESFALTGGILDVNWPSQTVRTRAGVKFAGVNVLSAKATIRNVTVINYGSNGLNVEHSEAFPIAVATYRDETTSIQIESCTVDRQHQYQGGYATGIIVVTTQDRYDGSHGDRIGWEIPRRSIAATIRNNTVRNVYGSAFGCGWTDNARFTENFADNCVGAFNCDTGRNRNVLLSGNMFLAVNHGIHVGNVGSGEFDSFTIRGNVFHLTEKWGNRFLNPVKTEFSYAVRLTRFPINVNIMDNTSMTWPPKSIDEGTYGIGWSEGAPQPNAKGNRLSGILTPMVQDIPFYIEDLRTTTSWTTPA